MVDLLQAMPDVIDIREVRLHSMQTDFWRGLEEQIDEASRTEGCEFVCWGTSNRYDNCPVPCVELSNFSDVHSYCEGFRSHIETRLLEDGREFEITMWEKPTSTPT